MNNGYNLRVKPYLEANKTNNLMTNMWIGTKLELIELGNVLRDDEDIIYLTACKWGNLRVLVCVTSMRLIALNKGIIANLFQESIFLNNISNVQRGRNLFFGNVTIYLNGGNYITLDSFWYKDTEKFVHAIETAVYNMGNARRQNYGYEGERGGIVHNHYYYGANVPLQTEVQEASYEVVNSSDDMENDLHSLYKYGLIDEETYKRKLQNRSR